MCLPWQTNTPVVCSQGAAGWVKSYMVKPGDTIYAIATNHYTTAGLLKSVNCRTSDLILVGEILWVPNVATRTPYPTPLPGSTVTPYPTDPLTETALPLHTPLTLLPYHSYNHANPHGRATVQPHFHTTPEAVHLRQALTSFNSNPTSEGPKTDCINYVNTATAIFCALPNII